MIGPLGNGVVDANEDFIVSWQVNGNSPLTRYLIDIRSESGSQIVPPNPLDKPFYGTDYAGNVQMFRANLGTLSLQNGKSYTMRIRQYWGYGDSDFVEQQSASTFITRDRPVVSIKYPYSGAYLSNRKVTVQASYSQAQGETLNWVRWRIAKMPENWDYSSEPEEIIEDSGPIYGTAQLQYPFDGVFSGNGYCVQCSVQTQSGMEGSSGWAGFYGFESGIQIETQIDACPGKNGVRLTFPEAVSIPAASGDETKTEDGQLILEGHIADSYADWDDIETSYPFNFVWRGSANIGGEYAQINLYDGADIRFANVGAEAEEAYTISGSGTWRTIVCSDRGGDPYMALGDSGVAYSSDAKTWTMATIPSALSGNLSALSLCAGYLYRLQKTVFFLASSATTTAAYTTDGITWTTVTMPKAVRNVFYAEGNLYAGLVGGGLAQTISASEWFTVSISGYSGTSEITGVSEGNNICVCVMADGSSAYIDYDDAAPEWKVSEKIAEPESGESVYGLCFGNGRFFVRVGNSGYYSDSGKDWSSSRSSGSVIGNGNNVVFGGNVFLCANGNNLSASMDASTWYEVTGSSTGTWENGCFDGKKFVFSGTNGKCCIFNTYLPVILDYGESEVGRIYAKRYFSFLLDGSKMYVCEDGNETLREFAAPMEWGEDQTIRNIRLNPHQTCDFVLISKGNLTAGQRLSVLRFGYDGSFPAYFYANFENGLNGGQFGSTAYDKFSVYRQEGSDAELQNVGDISVEDGNVLIDASAASGKTYTYHVYGAGQMYSNAIVSSPVHMCGWDWQILACTQDDDGAYHVQRIYRFSNNVSSGSVSNNAGPSIIQNFTRYPTVQNSPWNYRSGVLTSLIGYTADGKYYDTTELRDEIYALTTSGYALFLKNRKGDVIRIAISGAVEMETMDNAASQAQTVKIPWTEIGSAEDEQIVIMKKDGAYLQSIPSPVIGGYCDCGNGAARSFAYPLTVLQQSGTTVYDGSEAKKVVIKDGGGSGEIVAEDDGNGNITIY